MANAIVCKQQEYNKHLGVAMTTGGGDKSMVELSNDMSAVLATGSVSVAGASADTVGTSSVTMSEGICGSNADVAIVSISSGGCSTAADASTSSSGALTAVTAIKSTFFSKD